MSEVQVIASPSTRLVSSAFDTLDITERTKAEYQARLEDFLKFVNLNGFSFDSYLHYKQHLADRDDIGIAAKNKYLVAARGYIRELHRKGLLPVDISANVKAFKQTKKHKRTGLSEQEVERLMDFLNHDIDPSDPYNTRLKAVISLLLFQGLRQCEVSRLNWENVDLKHGLLYVRGKGCDDKEPVYLQPQTVRALNVYIATNNVVDLDMETGDFKHGPLFKSNSNNSQEHRLTTRSIYAMVIPVLQNLGINKSVHGFRHYYTTALIKHYEGHLLEVARYTRHRSLEMLQVYNDAVTQEADLPRFYKAFDSLAFDF